MKNQRQSTKVYTQPVSIFFFFSSVCKGYHLVLLIWRCVGIKYEADLVLRTDRNLDDQIDVLSWCLDNLNLEKMEAKSKKTIFLIWNKKNFQN